MNFKNRALNEQLSDICTQCGMCCDGTLFTHAKVKNEDDKKLAESSGLSILSTPEGELSFLQPCPHFKGCCAVYDQRPRVCSAFFCKPLKNAQKGNISLEKAHNMILSALSLRDNVLTLAAETDCFKDFTSQQLIQEVTPSPSENLKKYPTLLIKIIALAVASKHIRD